MSARARVVWEIAVRLCLLGDTHVGAARAGPRHRTESDVDLRTDRDPRSGLPRLRASTLAGLLRHELTTRSDDRERVRFLFGADQSSEEPMTSALDVDDALAELPEDFSITTRVGIRVDPASGTALPGRFRQWEVLPAGTFFTAHMRLWIPNHAEETQLLSLLLHAVTGLHGNAPGPHVGGHTVHGHGTVRATRWSVARHDLTEEQGWFAHHARTWEQRWRERAAALDEGPRTLTEALATQLRSAGLTADAAHLAAHTTPSDRRRRAELRMRLAVAERTEPLRNDSECLSPGLLMVGETPGTTRHDRADRVHRHRPVVVDPDVPTVENTPVLGDTALYALFKRMASRIARDACEQLGGRLEEQREWIAHWWGGDIDTTAPTPARVRLRDVPVIFGGAPLIVTRLTVDSLFGDAVDGHLFTSDLHCGGIAEVVLDVTDPDDAIRGLLALVVRDLATVAFDTLGADAGSGQGRLTALRARLTTHTGDDEPAHTVDLSEALSDPHGCDAETVRSWVAALRARLAPADRGKGEE